MHLLRNHNFDVYESGNVFKRTLLRSATHEAAIQCRLKRKREVESARSPQRIPAFPGPFPDFTLSCPESFRLPAFINSLTPLLTTYAASYINRISIHLSAHVHRSSLWTIRCLNLPTADASHRQTANSVCAFCQREASTSSISGTIFTRIYIRIISASIHAPSNPRIHRRRRSWLVQTTRRGLHRRENLPRSFKTLFWVENLQTAWWHPQIALKTHKSLRPAKKVRSILSIRFISM